MVNLKWLRLFGKKVHVHVQISCKPVLKFLDDLFGKSDHCAPTRALVALFAVQSEQKGKPTLNAA